MDKILFIFGNDVLPENIDLNDTKKLFYNYLCFLDRCGLKYHFENFQNEFKSNKLSRLKYRLLFKAENISFMLQEGILRKLKLQHSKKIF